jgi:hypothetical protein
MNSEQAGTDPTPLLVEQTAQPANDADREPIPVPAQNGQQDEQVEPVVPEEKGVIWTPRFIILFALTLVLGLSLESLLTQIWAIRWFTGEWVFLPHLALIGAGWIVLWKVSRSRWIRLGVVFGLIFVAFVTINIVLQAILFQPSSYLLAHVNVLTFLALAGCSMCFTIDHLPVKRWDAWVLGLMPVMGVVLLVPIYILRGDRSLAGLENSISIVALILSTLIWWMRPTCWRNAPGPTFLFGCVPLLLLLIYLAYVSSNSFNFFPVHMNQNATATSSSRQNVFFFSQVVLLILLLAIMRLVRPEKRTSPDR